MRWAGSPLSTPGYSRGARLQNSHLTVSTPYRTRTSNKRGGCSRHTISHAHMHRSLTVFPSRNGLEGYSALNPQTNRNDHLRSGASDLQIPMVGSLVVPRNREMHRVDSGRHAHQVLSLAKSLKPTQVLALPTSPNNSFTNTSGGLARSSTASELTNLQQERFLLTGLRGMRWDGKEWGKMVWDRMGCDLPGRSLCSGVTLPGVIWCTSIQVRGRRGAPQVPPQPLLQVRGGRPSLQGGERI